MPRDEPSLMPLLRSVAMGRSGLGGSQLDDQDVELVVEVGLGPLVWHIAKDDTAALSHVGRARLAGVDMAGEALYAALAGALCEILDAAGEVAGGVTLLKGVSVCRHYPRPFLRTMSDIDLLISPPSLPQMDRVLRELGYVPGDFGMGPGFYADHHHIRPFIHPISHVRVEAHRDLFPPDRKIPGDSPLGLANARSQIVASRFEDRDVFRFGPEMELLYIAAHWAYDMHLPLVYTGLLDALSLMRDEATRIDWDLVCSWSDVRETATPLCVLLGYLRQHELIEIDEKTAARLHQAPKSVGRFGERTLHRIVDRCLADGFRHGSRTKDVLQIVWRTLVSPQPPWTNLYSVPFDLVFPPHHPDRFSPGFQLHRLRSMLRPQR